MDLPITLNCVFSICYHRSYWKVQGLSEGGSKGGTLTNGCARRRVRGRCRLSPLSSAKWQASELVVHFHHKQTCRGAGKPLPLGATISRSHDSVVD
jgi:hypothetical protein